MRKYLYQDGYSPQRKCVAWGAIASAAGAALSAGASLIGAGAANKKSLQIARETNAANAKLAKEQNDWNEQMYLKYDTPAATKQQLLEAGYNPLYKDGSTGANLQSADLANQQAAQVDGNLYQQAAANLGNQTSAYFNNLVQQANESKLRAEIAKSEQERRFAEELFPYQKELSDFESQIRKYDLEGKQYDFADPDKVPDEIKKLPAYQNAIAKRDQLKANVDLLKQSYNFAKNMNPKQLKKLDQDIRSSKYNGDILEQSAILAKKYGISPHDEGLMGLVKIGLRDPDAYGKIIEGLIRAVGNGLSSGIKSLTSFMSPTHWFDKL